MTVLRTVRVAAIQATPVILDAEASVAKAVRLIGEAADAGAELAVLPECFVSLYPSNTWAKASASFGGSDELWERMWLSSVDVPGPLVDELAAVCRARGIHAVVGMNEREHERPGTLYNTMVPIGPEGLLHKHRKLMPTQHERLFHGIGAGDDLKVVDTAAGRVGGLICWENRMPLARYALYRQGVQIWVAPTADDSDGWIAHMRAIAIESGAFVVAAPQFIPRAAFPDDFPLDLPERDVYGRGGAVVVEPTWGEIVAGPLYGEEGMLVHDCDLRDGLHAKRWFDAVGHYSREEVLAVDVPDADLAWPSSSTSAACRPSRRRRREWARAGCSLHPDVHWTTAAEDELRGPDARDRPPRPRPATGAARLPRASNGLAPALDRHAGLSPRYDPSSHHFGPRSPSATFAARTAVARGPFRLPSPRRFACADRRPRRRSSSCTSSFRRPSGSRGPSCPPTARNGSGRARRRGRSRSRCEGLAARASPSARWR